jgi:ketosteroid isomerase-like protein
MKKNSFFIVLCVVLFANAVFSQKVSIDVSEVKKFMNLQQEAWNEGSLEGFMKYYWKNDSLKFIGNKGITWGWQAALDNYKKNYPTKEAMGQLNFEVTEAEQLNTRSVFIIGKYHLKKEGGKDADGVFTLLWRKFKGRWLIVVDHTS